MSPTQKATGAYHPQAETATPHEGNLSEQIRAPSLGALAPGTRERALRTRERR